MRYADWQRRRRAIQGIVLAASLLVWLVLIAVALWWAPGAR